MAKLAVLFDHLPMLMGHHFGVVQLSLQVDHLSLQLGDAVLIGQRNSSSEPWRILATRGPMSRVPRGGYRMHLRWPTLPAALTADVTLTIMFCK